MSAEGFTAGQFAISNCIKLGTIFAISTIPYATRLSVKQNIQFQNKIDWQ